MVKFLIIIVICGPSQLLWLCIIKAAGDVKTFRHFGVINDVKRWCMPRNLNFLTIPLVTYNGFGQMCPEAEQQKTIGPMHWAIHLNIHQSSNLPI